MRFPYVYLPAGGNRYIGLPIITIELQNNEQKQKYLCLIDSGADYSLFDAEIGEAIGLDIKNGIAVRSKGINKNIVAEAYMHRISYSVGDIQCEADVAFTYDLSTAHGILGRNGFFNHFLVVIDEKKQEVEISPYKK